MGRTRRIGATSIGLVLLFAVSLTGCNRFGFSGVIDSITTIEEGPHASNIQIAGWVRSTTGTPWALFATVDGVVSLQVRAGGTQSSDDAFPRADVDQRLGGHPGGFEARFATLSRGRHRICVHAVPASAPVPRWGDRHPEGTDDVACQWYLEARDWTPRGDIDRVTVANGVVTVEGWLRWFTTSLALNPFGNTAGLLANGRVPAPLSADTVLPRPDVDAVYGPGTTGFRSTFTLDPSVSQWCISTYMASFIGQDGTPSGTPDNFDCAAQPA